MSGMGHTRQWVLQALGQHRQRLLSSSLKWHIIASRNSMKWKFRLACWSVSFVCLSVPSLHFSQKQSSPDFTLQVGTSTGKNYLDVQGHVVRGQGHGATTIEFWLAFDLWLIACLLSGNSAHSLTCFRGSSINDQTDNSTKHLCDAWPSAGSCFRFWANRIKALADVFVYTISQLQLQLLLLLLLLLLQSA